MPKIKHGMEGTEIYNVWLSIKQRCLNPNNPRYKNYGARGIKICPEWLNSFENFYQDMGDIPISKSIDRIDNNGNYETSNCRWANKFQQANNTSRNIFLTYKGKTQTIAQWSRELNIKYDIIYWRIRNNWSIERALKIC